MTFEFGLSTTLGFLGLSMAIVELNIPNLSRGLEQRLDDGQEKFVSLDAMLRNAPIAVNSWVMGSKIGRVYSKHWPAFLVVGLLLALISGSVPVSDACKGALVFVGLLPIGLVVIYRYIFGQILDFHLGSESPFLRA